MMQSYNKMITKSNVDFLINIHNIMYACPDDATEDEKKQYYAWKERLRIVLRYNEGELTEQDKKDMQSLKPYWKEMQKEYEKDWTEFRNYLEWFLRNKTNDNHTKNAAK